MRIWNFFKFNLSLSFWSCNKLSEMVWNIMFGLNLMKISNKNQHWVEISPKWPKNHVFFLGIRIYGPKSKIFWIWTSLTHTYHQLLEHIWEIFRESNQGYLIYEGIYPTGPEFNLDFDIERLQSTPFD